MADRQRLVQVLNNLLANAARHAPDSAPIRIAAAREGLSVAVSVADEGRGIAPDQLGQLFRKYTTAGDRKGGLGSGLGLAICKGLVEAQGGRIRAESGGVGFGARFTFTIPVAEAASDSPGPARPGPPGHAPDAVPILVVDDDPETLRHLRDTLAEAGYAPLVTGDPGDLPRLVQTEKPRLVLLDLMLPGTDGVELMQTVPELADLPVIFISGYGRDETIARALEAGAEDYVVKPFSPTELTARIRAALRRRSNPVPFVLGELAIDYDRRRVSVAGRPGTLTATEYELLRVLAQGAGRVLTHEALLRQVWSRRGNANPKIVRAYVKRLRHRLGDDAAQPSLDRQRARSRLPHGPPRRPVDAVVAEVDRACPERARVRPGVQEKAECKSEVAESTKEAKRGAFGPKPMAIATCVGRGSTSASGTLTTLCLAFTKALMMCTTFCLLRVLQRDEESGDDIQDAPVTDVWPVLPGKSDAA